MNYDSVSRGDLDSAMSDLHRKIAAERYDRERAIELLQAEVSGAVGTLGGTIREVQEIVDALDVPELRRAVNQLALQVAGNAAQLESLNMAVAEQGATITAMRDAMVAVRVKLDELGSL